MRSRLLCLAIFAVTACASLPIVNGAGGATPTPTIAPTGIGRTPFRYAMPAPGIYPVTVTPQSVTITKQQDRYVATVPSAFRVMQLTDVHFDGNATNTQKTKQLITDMVKRFKPDLIALTGDLAWTILGSTENMVKDGTKFMNDLCVSQNCYWAYTIGNHDAWSLLSSPFTRRNISDIVAPYALDKSGGRLLYYYAENPSKPDESSVRFSLELQETSGAPLWELYFLDNSKEGSRAHYLDASTSEADRIWFADAYTSAKQRSRYSDLPAFAFFHIPLTQYDSAWNGNEAHGFRYEGVSGQADSIKMMEVLSQNGVVACFAGHDHLNNFRAHWALGYRNLYMYYGRYSGYGAPDSSSRPVPNSYPDFQPGCMLIDMDLNARCWTTWQWDAKLGASPPRNLDTAEKLPSPKPS